MLFRSMEDGFLRSSGLGSDLLPPLSLVLDKRGIYYDATRPSDLEVLINHSQLTLAQQMRAEKLRQRLVESKLSKYNLGADFSLPAEAKDKKIILVPGQVEDDASIKTGTVSIKSNLELLRTGEFSDSLLYLASLANKAFWASLPCVISF